MSVTVDSLVNNFDCKVKDETLKQILQILFDDGKLNFDENENTFVHRV